MNGTDRLAASAGRLQSHFGGDPRAYGTWVAKRGHTLHDSAGLAATVEVADAALLGATAVILRAADSGRLSGEIPAGLALTIGAVEYEASAVARADDSEITVLLTGPLLAPVAEGAEVTMEEFVVFELPQSVANMASARSIPPDLVETVTREVLVTKSLAPAAYRPQAGDFLVSPDGAETLRMAAFSTDQPGLWGLLAGSAA